MQTRRTKPCKSCGETFEYERSTARYCSERCKKRAQRGEPSLERVVASQRRASRRHDAHVQRPQELGGERVRPIMQTAPGTKYRPKAGEFLVIDHDGSSHVAGAAYARTIRGGLRFLGVNAGPSDPTQNEALSHKSPQAMWRQVLWDATEEFVYALHPRFRQPWELPEESRQRAVVRWALKLRRHPELTYEGWLYIVTTVPQDYVKALEGAQEGRPT